MTFARVLGEFVGKGGEEDLPGALAEGKGRFIHRFRLAEGRGSGPDAPLGSEILDVVEVAEGQFWWGHRKVGPWDWGCPGGVPNLVLPELAPSRAWLKLEEMLLWSRWAPPPGTGALELGSAPGGASWALLNRGLRVIGVDVAPMAAVCLDHPAYSHLGLSVRDVRKKDLPHPVEVLFCDLGLKPVEAVPQIRHFCHILPSLKRVYYTLKMGEGLDTRNLDGWKDAFVKMGFSVQTTHLPSNRLEIFLLATR